MVRVRETLMSRTAATVLSTTRDGSTYLVPDRDVLEQSKNHAVLTTPPYPIAQASISAHMRWYLSNQVYAQAKKQGTPSDKVVFLSIHADSLHPSLRGAMAYLPGLLGTVDGFGKTGTVYSSRAEVRSQPRVSFSYKERVRSEGLSRDLAENIMESFRSHGLAIHKNKPVRDRIIRRQGRAWVPAVLKYNAVPAKVLIEVCNLGNEDDRRLIRTRAYRQKAAEAIVDGLLAYYGQNGGGASGSLQTAGVGTGGSQ
jgi:N-acetylmuramoyl-L-alanine amidase